MFMISYQAFTPAAKQNRTGMLCASRQVLNIIVHVGLLLVFLSTIMESKAHNISDVISQTEYIALQDLLNSAHIPIAVSNCFPIFQSQSGWNDFEAGDYLNDHFGNRVWSYGLIIENVLLNTNNNVLVKGNLASVWLYANSAYTIPTSIGNLSQLFSLDLSGGVCGVIPKTVGSLTQLEALTISGVRQAGGQLTGSIPDSIGNLVKLAELDLRGNLLTGPIPSTLTSCGHLEMLKLENNQLNGPIPANIGSLTNLEVARLFNNKLSGSIPNSITNAVKLLSIDLSSNKITGAIPPGLSRDFTMTNLQSVNLSFNELTGDIPYLNLGGYAVYDYGTFVVYPNSLNISHNYLNILGNQSISNILLMEANGDPKNIVYQPQNEATLSFHQLTESGLMSFASGGIDDPLIPTTSIDDLQAQPIILGGLVADGVTPLLVKVDFEVPLPSQRFFNISTANQLGESAPILIATLGKIGWQDGNSLTVEKGASSAFFYVKPIRCEDVNLLGNPEITTEIVLSEADSSLAITNTLHIRKPPIALIHGYNSGPDAWSYNFASMLYNSRPEGFVVSVGYGFPYGDGADNTSGRLDVLAKALDFDLQNTIESLHSEWAFTRYDVIGHSQGGLLARMLCQNSSPPLDPLLAPFSSAPVVSSSNFGRGRFRRVVTIGSPHNGSTLLHYLLQLKNNNSDGIVQILTGFLDGLDLLQPKFDPFGLQIAEVNDQTLPVDQRIKFLCLATGIYGGKPPDQFTTCPVYRLLELGLPGIGGSGITRGGQLLPNGSDGVVNVESQRGGPQTDFASFEIGFNDISHFDMPSVFGNFAGMSQTQFSDVASYAIERLDGPANGFGSFGPLPAKLPAAQQAMIDELAEKFQSADIITPVQTVPSSRNYRFTITSPTNGPGSGAVNWFARIFGVDGIYTDGLKLVVSSNSFNATLSVDSTVVGQVVIYASYASTNGSFVMANPVVVDSQPLSPVYGLDLQPSFITLSPGDSKSTSLFGLYTNGFEMIFYVTNGLVSYTSSDPAVASVDRFGSIFVHSYGFATITASYGGFSAQSFVTTVPPSVSALRATAQNGYVQLSFAASIGSTWTLETSTNLSDWLPDTTLVSTNGYLNYLERTLPGPTQRFYRITPAF